MSMRNVVVVVVILASAISNAGGTFSVIENLTHIWPTYLINNADKWRRTKNNTSTRRQGGNLQTIINVFMFLM